MKDGDIRYSINSNHRVILIYIGPERYLPDNTRDRIYKIDSNSGFEMYACDDTLESLTFETIDEAYENVIKLEYENIDNIQKEIIELEKAQDLHRNKKPCSQGCMGHVTHPCENCGLIWTNTNLK